MNKRIIAVLLALMLVVSLSVTAVPFSAANSSVSLTIAADVSEASPGSMINFTVTLGPVSDLGVIKFSLAIPSGLTFVSGSGTCSVTKADLGFSDLGFDEEDNYTFCGRGSESDYESTTDTVLMTFQCVVNDDACETQTVGFAEIQNEDFRSCQTPEEWGDRVSTISADITILTEVEDLTDPPTEEPTSEPTVAPTAAPTDPPAKKHTSASTKISSSGAAKTLKEKATRAPTEKPTKAAVAGNLPKKPSPTEKSKATDASDAPNQWSRNGKKDGTTPKTGDNTPKNFWLLIILASVIAAGGVLYIVKRRITRNSNR